MRFGFLTIGFCATAGQALCGGAIAFETEDGVAVRLPPQVPIVHRADPYQIPGNLIPEFTAPPVNYNEPEPLESLLDDMPTGIVDSAELLETIYPWRKEIVTTVFWIGEKPTKNNPVTNEMSSWDRQWSNRYGGYDNPCPTAREGFRPAGFRPRQNPFYVALPYNDIDRSGTKPEASEAIPWFAETFVRSGQSVVKGRWVAIRKGDKVAYAQWEDAGPFRTDHWQYVFGHERPSPNRNKSAGLDVSPSVRDYLGMSNMDITDWRFVEVWEVPEGPWRKYGANNLFALLDDSDT